MTEPERARIDVQQAMRDPNSVFPSPEAVLRDPSLTRDQKIEILRRWEYDAAEIAVAVEEGMPDRNDEDVLGRILLSLAQLTGGRNAERSGPTKQHGLPKGIGD